MATAVEVAAYRCAGHSVAETCEHFGIKERAVYKACQTARIRQRQEKGIRPRPAFPQTLHEAKGVFLDVASDEEVAGDNTYWKCPVTGELLPIVPGSRRKTWTEERKALHARLAYTRHKQPVSAEAASTSVRAPAPPSTASESEIAPTALPSADVPKPVPLVLSTQSPEYIVIVKRYEVTSHWPHILAYPLLHLREHAPPPQILLALAITAVLIILCSM